MAVAISYSICILIFLPMLTIHCLGARNCWLVQVDVGLNHISASCSMLIHLLVLRPQVGNMIFWFIFSVFGQPMCVLLYYHDLMNRKGKLSWYFPTVKKVRQMGKTQWKKARACRDPYYHSISSYYINVGSC